MASSRGHRQAGFLAAAALTALAVAGCGSVTAAMTGSGSAASASRASASGAGASASGAGATVPGQPARPYLCAHPGASRRVLIAKTGSLRILEGRPRAQPAGSLPPVTGGRPVMIRTVTRLPQVHALAMALCALPRMPREPLPCPALFFGSYQFYFTAVGRQLPAVVVQETGCRIVTGLGPARRADQPAFWRLLDRIIGSYPAAPSPRSPGSVQPGGPDLPGSGLNPACVPTPGQPLRACPFQSGQSG